MIYGSKREIVSKMIYCSNEYAYTAKRRSIKSNHHSSKKLTTCHNAVQSRVGFGVPLGVGLGVLTSDSVGENVGKSVRTLIDCVGLVVGFLVVGFCVGDFVVVG